jgi:choice-of-anchor C domain-containing protein
MKMTRQFVAVSAALVAACAAGTASAQIVQNGSFESPAVAPSPFEVSPPQPIDGWTVTAGSVDLIDGYWQAHSGVQSIDLSGDAPGTLTQDVSLDTGQLYLLTFWVSGNPDGPPDLKTFDFSVTNTTPMTVANINFLVASPPQSRADMNWQPREWLFLAGEGPHTLVFQSTTPGPFGPALDDVGVTLVPEPETYAMLLAGMGFIGFIARRRRRRSGALAA